MKKKKCIKCSQEKEFDKFVSDKKSKNGLSNICSECNRKLVKEYYYDHQSERIEYQKIYNLKNVTEKKEYDKEYRKKNLERIKKNKAIYFQINKKLIYSKRKDYHNNWEKNKRNIDPKYRLDVYVGNAIYSTIKKNKNKKHWEKLVDYSLKELIKHLEKQFDEKMSWDNYGPYWHIDHIKPKSLFHYVFPEDIEFKKCWALENLQPLEKIENIKKFNHYNYGN